MPKLRTTLFGRLKRDERGGVAILEFTMLSIPAIIIILAVTQTILLAQATVVMESAAYAAARSALAHKCRPISPLAGDESVVSAIAGAFCNDSEAEQHALTAARVALVPISASNPDSRGRQGSCGHPDALVDFIVGAGVRGGLRDAVEQKACYAFEPGNVQVETRWMGTLGGAVSISNLPPIEATVRFRLPIFVPVRGVFSTGQHSDGAHYRDIEATVRLL